jgi:hypothetical protein
MKNGKVVSDQISSSQIAAPRIQVPLLKLTNDDVLKVGPPSSSPQWGPELRVRSCRPLICTWVPTCWPSLTGPSHGRESISCCLLFSYRTEMVPTVLALTPALAVAHRRYRPAVNARYRNPRSSSRVTARFPRLFTPPTALARPATKPVAQTGRVLSRAMRSMSVSQTRSHRIG